MTAKNKEKENRRVLAIAKKLKEQKGYVVNKLVVDSEVKKLKKAQQEIAELAEGNDSAIVKNAVRENNAKLQNIINDINQYMGVVYPEGLIDIGGEEEVGGTMAISG